MSIEHASRSLPCAYWFCFTHKRPRNVCTICKQRQPLAVLLKSFVVPKGTMELRLGTNDLELNVSFLHCCCIDYDVKTKL